MGLNIHPGNVNWSYSGFNRFREKVAAAYSIKLSEMEGFTEGEGIPWSMISNGIKYLLNHSDCDGEIPPEECKSIIPQLRAVISYWNKDDYDTITGFSLITSMEECVSNNKPLIFS